MTNKQTTAVQFLIEKLDANLDIKHSWRTKQYIEEATASSVIVQTATIRIR